MEASGYHQANTVDEIVSHMSGLPSPYPPQDPECNPTLNPDPTIVTTVQPTPVANVATYVSTTLPQILNSMQHMHQLLIHMKTNQKGGGEKKINQKTRTLQAATEPR